MEAKTTERKAHNHNWVIVGLTQPVIWSRDDDENWMLNPPRRYILNADLLGNLQPYVDSISDLKTSKKFHQLQGGANLASSKILIERCRDRGIGDMLFMTGPMNYIKHVSGGTAQVYMHGLTDRSQVLSEHESLYGKTIMHGPIHYEDLDLYNYHWFIENVTEYDEEPDQLNVYDALYKQVGLDPSTIDPRWKRPTIHLSTRDSKNLDTMYFMLWKERKIDLRKTGYYVVAPLSHSTLRSMRYSTWLNLIVELSNIRPVIVIGHVYEGRMVATDMSFGAFNAAIHQMNAPHIINLMGHTPIRVIMSMIQKAVGVICLDSGPLYIAQGLRTPAISLWGTHHPGCRIGYDREYMDMAIWNGDACRNAPCYAYASIPTRKCPREEDQSVCECLLSVETKQVMEKVDKIETARKGEIPAIPARS